MQGYIYIKRIDYTYPCTEIGHALFSRMHRLLAIIRLIVCVAIVKTLKVIIVTARDTPIICVSRDNIGNEVIHESVRL